MADATVLVRPAGSYWGVLGVDHLPGVPVEDVQVTGNGRGPDTATWTMRTSPRAPHPEVAKFVPCEVWEGGALLLEGRIWDTPGRDGDEEQVTVTARGDQYRLDDASVERVWIYSDLTAWQDHRSLLEADLTVFIASARAGAGEGGIELAFANGSPLGAASGVGVTLDLGPVALWERVAIEWEHSSNDSGVTFYARGSDVLDPLPAGTFENAFSFAITGAASGSSAGSFLAPRRYLHLFMFRNAPGTPGADVWIRLKAVRAFRDAAYESGGASALTTSTLLLNAAEAAEGAGLDARLVADGGEVEPTTLALPSASSYPAKMLGEVIEGANSLHNYQAKVLSGRRLKFAPRPTVPLFETGAWSRNNFDDGGDSAEEVYNRVIMYATGEAGDPLRVERWAGQLSNVPGELITDPAFINPSADVDAAGWATDGAGVVVRNTVGGRYHSSPAGIEWTGFSSVPVETLTAAVAAGGTFEGDVSYRLTLQIRGLGRGVLRFGTLTDYVEVAYWDAIGVDFKPRNLVWRPGADYPSDVVSFKFGSRTDPKAPLTSPAYVDTLTLETVAPTALDQQGDVRTFILNASTPMTAEVMTAFCDVFLRAHMRTPYKGGGTFLPGDLRDYGSGADRHPRELIDKAGELIYFSDVTDPDTGRTAREAAVASVSYACATEEASVQLDSSADDFGALMARYAAVAEAGRAG